MRQKVEDSDCHKFPIEAVALVVRSQLEGFATDFEYLSVNAGAEKSLEGSLLPA
jgi:hypothetical protein